MFASCTNLLSQEFPPGTSSVHRVEAPPPDSPTIADEVSDAGGTAAKKASTIQSFTAPDASILCIRSQLRWKVPGLYLSPDRTGN